MSIRNLIPREHGVWAILSFPYFVGVAVEGGITWKEVLGFFGIILLFLSRQSLLLILKSYVPKNRVLRIQRRKLGQSFFLFFGGGVGIFLWLLFKYRLAQIVIIGLIAAFLFVLHTFLALYQKERTVVGELLGVGLLTLSVLLGVVLSGGKLTREAFILWLLNAFYFAGSIFYIKMRKRAVLARHKILNISFNVNLVRECLAYMTLLIIILVFLVFIGSVPVLVPLAFVPMVAHTLWGIFALRPRFEIIKQGFIQTGLSLIFVVLLVILWK